MNHETRSVTRRLADRLLARFIGRTHREEFQGDLDESYDFRKSSKGKFTAEVMYFFDSLHLIYGFSSTVSKYPTRHAMFTGNLFRIAWRNAIRHKQFTILNLLGLTIGIATCLIIALYVYDESTYDRFYAKGDRIYRVNQPFIWGDWDRQFASTGPGIAEALREEIPELEQVTRLLAQDERTVRRPGKQPAMFVERRFFWADPNVFDVFSYPFLKGNPATALKEPNSAVITTSTAKKYFGDEEPIGKVLEMKISDNSYVPYTVKGVIADLPSASHLQFDILGSLATLPEMKTNGTTWIWTTFGTYVLVRQGSDMATLTKKIQALPRKWAAATTQRVFNQSFDAYTAGKKWTLYLQPLRSIYLASAPASHRFGPSGNAQFVVVFAVTGALVLVLSCINFMNLSTARSGTRAKEVGVRKVLGSGKGILARQFITESTLYVAAATAFALIVAQLSLSGFNILAEKQLNLLAHFADPRVTGMLILFVLLLGIFAGSYPAFYLSSFQPAETLKGKVRAGLTRSHIRNGLVVFQFTVSIALIVCTLFVQKQLAFISTMNVGIARDHVLQLHYMEQLGTNVDVLKNQLAANPAFTQVGISHSIPPNVWEGDRYKSEGADKPVVDLAYLRVDEQYLPLLGTEFLAGRNFNPANPADKHKIILNEEAVRVLGWGTRNQWKNNSPLGKHVVQAFGAEEKLEVIGVVKDFNFNSVRQNIAPLLVMHRDNDLHWSYHSGPLFLSMRLNPQTVRNNDEMQGILDDLRTKIKAIDPSVVFQFSFLDQEYESSFRSERRMGTILNLFTMLAVSIACIGLFGLAAFSAEQRLKELGIRKVMGANVRELVFLFSSEFTRLVAVAVLLAAPVAWWFTDKWLANFAYRTRIDIWVFVAAAVSALAIAILTISYQAVAAARTNPVDTLRRE